jgi:hypothetical protein
MIECVDLVNGPYFHLKCLKKQKRLKFCGLNALLVYAHNSELFGESANVIESNTALFSDQ